MTQISKINGIPLVNNFVTGMTFNQSTYEIVSTRNDGFSTVPIDLSILSADVNITGGTYDIDTGIVTFTNNSGGTFNVSGFTSGMTDSYTTSANLSGDSITFDNNIEGVNFYNVSLLPLLSGKTDLSLFNTYTGDTATELASKALQVDLVTHTGDTNNPHNVTIEQVSGVSETLFNTYTGNTETLIDAKVETTLFNTYTGDTQTTLNTKFDTITSTGGTVTIVDGGATVNLEAAGGGETNTASNIGGGEGLFSGKTGVDLEFKSLTSTGGTVVIDSTGATVNLEAAALSTIYFRGVSDDTGDYNVASPLAIPWDGANIKSAGITHSTGTTPTRVTVDEAGQYDIYASAYYESSATQRAQLKLTVWVNGVQQTTVGEGQGGYARFAGSANRGMSHVATILDLSADDYIEIRSELDAITGAVALIAGQSVFKIHKLNGTKGDKGDTGAAGAGETNTASNVGGGEGLYNNKTGVDLEFKSLTSTGGTVTISSTGETVNVESVNPTLSKTFTLQEPTATDDITMFRTDVAITVQEITTVNVGTTPSTTFVIKHDTTRSATGTNVANSQTSTNTGTGAVITINDATIPVNSWIWLETSAASGTDVYLTIDIRYTED